MKPPYMRRKGATLHASRQEFIRWQLPYGLWRCVDGREVLFDRDYCPICERSPDKSPQLADPHEFVRCIVHQEWFYNDATPRPKRREIAKAKLIEWGLLKVVFSPRAQAV